MTTALERFKAVCKQGARLSIRTPWNGKTRNAIFQSSSSGEAQFDTFRNWSWPPAGFVTEPTPGTFAVTYPDMSMPIVFTFNMNAG